MTDQLFKDNEPNPSTQTTETPTNSPDNLFSDQLKDIKNENGEPKYDTVEKGLEALKHSQSYIQELKASQEARDNELNQLKAKLEAMESVQEVVSRQTPQEQGQATSQPALGEEQVLELAKQALKAEQEAQASQQNYNTVATALTEKFGDKAAEAIAQKASEHNMSPSQLGELSKSNPSMVLALFSEGGAPAASPTTGSYNLSHTPPAQEEVAPPEKSLMRGASTRDRMEYMKKIKEQVYKKHGITQ